MSQNTLGTLARTAAIAGTALMLASCGGTDRVTERTTTTTHDVVPAGQMVLPPDGTTTTTVRTQSQ